MARENIGTIMIEILDLEAELRNWEAVSGVRSGSGGRSGRFKG